MRMFNWVGCIFAAGLGGCSVYPIPDDVSYSPTENIVRFARCEMRASLIDYLRDEGLITPPTTPEGIKKQIAAAKATLNTPPKNLTKEARDRLERLVKLGKVAVVYAFDFDIKEHNNTGASAAFKLPWLTSNVLDVNASASLDLTRQGHRAFTSEDSWDELLTNNTRCMGVFEQPTNPGNFVYPLTGSIGVGRVVKTFIDIDEQGGAKDSFVDTLTFTTEATGGADAAVKLAPVPDQFRPVGATAAVSASRLDIHKLTLSLVFPRPDPIDAITGVKRTPGDLNAPFERPAPWRARYNLCVQDARTRENTFKRLRLTDPVVYCITYADLFAPADADKTVAVRVSRAVRVPAAPGALESAAPRTRIEQQIIPRQVRPNYTPGFQ